jgi:hypothetical protein
LRGAPPGLPFQWDERTIKAGLNFTLTSTVGDLDLLGEVPRRRNVRATLAVHPGNLGRRRQLPSGDLGALDPIEARRGTAQGPRGNCGIAGSSGRDSMLKSRAPLL